MSDLEIYLAGLRGNLSEATAKVDLKYTRKAEALAKKIMAFLKSRNAPKVIKYQEPGNAWNRKHEALTVWLADIDRKYEKIILVLQRRSADPKARGSMGPVFTGSPYKALKLYILPDDVDLHDYLETQEDAPTEIAPWGMKTIKAKLKLPLFGWVHNTIVHELVHAWDFERGGAGFAGSVTSGELHSKGKTKEYYNTPEEFNAFYQQGANEVHRIVRQVVSGIKSGNKGMISDAEQIIWSFDGFIKNMSHAWRPDWVENLGTKYRRKFKKRIVDLYNHVREQVRDAYRKQHGGKDPPFTSMHQARARQQNQQSYIARDWPMAGSSRLTGTSHHVAPPSERLFIPGKR